MFDEGLTLGASLRIGSVDTVQQLGRRYRGNRDFLVVS
jgi:hypothetical protein